MEDVETEENVSNVCKSAKQAKEYAKNNANDNVGNVGKETWEKKPMHGQYIRTELRRQMWIRRTPING